MATQTSTKIKPGATTVRFTGTVVSVAERAIVKLTDAASAELPSRGQVAVAATLNSESLTTVVEPDGMKGHWLDVDGTLQIGATVDVELTPIKDWPEPQVPQDLRAALAEASDIADVWDDITPMARWEWVRWIGATKNPDTRAKRVDVSIDKLRGGKRRPCCFDLSSCTDPELSKSGKLIDVD